MRLPPNVWFHPDFHLMIFRHRGILDEKRVNTIVEFIEKEENRAETPFNRFADLSKLDAVDLDFKYVFRIALHRRQSYARRPAIKSAFYVTSPATERIVKIHAILTDHSPLRVRMFKDVAAAAKWLAVPTEILEIDVKHVKR